MVHNVLFIILFLYALIVANALYHTEKGEVGNDNVINGIEVCKRDERRIPARYALGEGEYP